MTAQPFRSVDAAIGASSIPGNAILSVEEITLSFDGFKALDDLTLSLERGELRCIIGPNGAGKTTLFNLIAGAENDTEG